MLKIRKDVFETNSSSSHCLSYSNVDKKTVSDNFLKQYADTIYPYNWSDVDKPMIITTLKDKLRYLYTVILQVGLENDCYSKSGKLLNELKSLLPNVTFADDIRDDAYVFEDAEYLLSGWSDHKAEIDKWLGTPHLKNFLKYGMIVYWDRDCEWQTSEYEPNYAIMDNSQVIYFMG